MKNVRMLVSLLIVIFSGFAIAQNDSNKVKALGHGLHMAANHCSAIRSDEEFMAMWENLVLLGNDMTLNEIAEASEFKNNGVNAFNLAKSKNCAYCVMLAQCLESGQKQNHILRNNFQAGSLKMFEYLANDELQAEVQKRLKK